MNQARTGNNGRMRMARIPRNAPTSTYARGDWGVRVPEDQWSVYDAVLDRFSEEGVDHALGGAFALATYSGIWRNTKDLDLYVKPADRHRVMEILGSAGLADYFDVLPYDRGWIYRSYVDETIVDAIWGMPNRRAQCDVSWVRTGPEIQVRDRTLRVVPPDRLVFAKIFVLQRPRCDWPDIINVIYGAGDAIDWDRLIVSLGDDLPLLRSVMSTFAWLAPGRAQQLDPALWTRLGTSPPEDGPEFDAHRVRLLETRPWFAPLIALEEATRTADG